MDITRHPFRYVSGQPKASLSNYEHSVPNQDDLIRIGFSGRPEHCWSKNMFNTILIANRGAIATRIIRTLKSLNIKSVCIYHEVDKDSLHVQQADVAVSLGEGSAADTYLNIDKILDIAKQFNVDAIHPGYGFLSENTDIVLACETSGIVFIGPTATHMNLFGLKHQAREIAEKANVPLVPGSPLLTSLSEAITHANEIGYPVMLKSTAGGGGIGMQVCDNEEALIKHWESVKRLSQNYFSNADVFIEKFVRHARHIEVQIFGDGNGNVISLGERDCSAQRRNQKVIEETPAPNLSQPLRQSILDTAERLMASVHYRNAGTVEFIFDEEEKSFYFLEVNTRLQVEHGVTEQVWGVDLVECMIRQAAQCLGDLPTLKASLNPQGHSLQVRLYAENPNNDFLPCAGLLSDVHFPSSPCYRIDHWIESGLEVSPLFDPMLAKVIVTKSDRASAITSLIECLESTTLYGIETNKDYVASILKSDIAQQGKLLTHSLSHFPYHSATMDILSGGTQTTIQDYPGREHHWHVGVPPSGPMDRLNFQLANQLLGNGHDAAALEITLNGPTIRFNQDTLITLTGAEFEATLDDVPVAFYTPVAVKKHQVLSVGKVIGRGARCYLAVSGGVQCPSYLGSRATFILGQFGGHNGRALRAGDTLHLSQQAKSISPLIPPEVTPPVIHDVVNLRVMYGPHGAPDFFTETDIIDFFEHTWEVHYNSSRTGVRLIGPKPKWARESGGEAGMHPSNIHDNAYAFGTVDFTGDMPVILGPDGPSLGGFVCPATVINADLWKLGQLSAGQKIRFIPVHFAQAVEAERTLKQSVLNLCVGDEHLPCFSLPDLIDPIVYRSELEGDELVIRSAGDQFLLLELGPLELDIPRRLKIHSLMLWLDDHKPEGMMELTPGIRSLQIHYDSQALAPADIFNLVDQACQHIRGQARLTVPSRIIHLPLSWDDEACQLAIEKYTQSVRENAPWCPSNIEFIRRINGLNSIEDVKKTVFDANYLVMGLGDVYLGAPVATPMDPRHRLVTTKYNPARTWTAENSVGIGGAYMCVYGMEGPGGYQFVGRTSQIWNRYKPTKSFTQPWLLNVFDQIKFFEVSREELHEIREKLPKGQYDIQWEETELNLEDYETNLIEQQASIEAFKQKREQAFATELNTWKANGQFTYEAKDTDNDTVNLVTIPEHCTAIDSPVSGSVWKTQCQTGDTVKKGQLLMILESMKMEIEVHAHTDGKVHSLMAQTGKPIQAGQALAFIETE